MDPHKNLVGSRWISDSYEFDEDDQHTVTVVDVCDFRDADGEIPMYIIIYYRDSTPAKRISSPWNVFMELYLNYG